MCVLTTVDFQHINFDHIKPGTDILFGYGGGRIKNISACVMKASFKNKTVYTKFNIIELSVPASSLLGYNQSWELHIITIHPDHVIKII